MTGQVRFQWNDLAFLLKICDFLIRNLDFLLKNVDLFLKTEHYCRWRLDCVVIIDRPTVCESASVATRAAQC